MYSLIVIFKIFHETCSVTMCGQSHQRYHECRKPFVYHVDHIYYRCRTLKDCDLSLFCVTWRYVIRFRRIKSEIKEKGIYRFPLRGCIIGLAVRALPVKRAFINARNCISLLAAKESRGKETAS